MSETVIAIPGTTLPSILEGDTTAPAIVIDGEGTLLTRGVLASRVTELASQLNRAGIEAGSRVALSLVDGAALVETLLAVVSLGAAAAPLNPAYTAPEFDFYLNDLEPDLLVLPSGEMRAAREAAQSIVHLRVADLDAKRESTPRLIVSGGRLRRATPSSAPGPDDIALLLHTSGTTSKPKQVPLLHRNLLASIAAIIEHYGLVRQDVSYCLMPLFHVHGLVASCWATLASGGTVIVPTRRSPRLFWKALQDRNVTWFSASPTIHQMMIEHGTARTAESALRFVRTCSAALPASLQARLETVYGVPVLQAYGMTEASHQIASNPLPPRERFPETVGLPTGTEVRVVNDAGNAVSAGRVGHVLVKGPGITPGYLDDLNANADAFIDGWFRTGDIGMTDEAGYLRLEGRAKELIIRGGENISPYEVESVLLAHDAVSDAVCFAIPDGKYGETVGAAVTVRMTLTEEQLKAHCRELLASFKVPTAVYVLDAIPRTATGKLQRRRMHTLLTGES